MEFLVRRPVHATADEIHRALNRSDPRASRATVYNSLRALIKAGLVREVILEGAAARFDAKVHRHHHFICDRCGRVEDIEWFDLPRRSQSIALGPRIIREYQVVFNGTCRKCRAN
jgi:Fur family peroxide stress response transcriptional regulator